MIKWADDSGRQGEQLKAFNKVGFFLRRNTMP